MRKRFRSWAGLPRWGALTSIWLTAAGQAPRAGGDVALPGRETGRIEGVASIAAVLTTIHQRIRVYDEPGTSPPKSAGNDNPLANVVIYLESSAALHVETSPNSRPPAALRQRDQMFVPHVLPVLVGTTVQFPNDDAVFHDVFSLSSTKVFDLQRYPQGTSRSVQFLKRGVVEVFCHIHADMSAYIVVLDNPFFVVPDAQGHFALDGVPPGDYQLTAWYERTHPVTVRVHVDAGRTATVPMRIPIPAGPPHP